MYKGVKPDTPFALVDRYNFDSHVRVIHDRVIIVV